MTNLFKREYGDQKNIKLFVDQEKRIEELKKKHGKVINVSELIRTGVDKILDELEKDN